MILPGFPAMVAGPSGPRYENLSYRGSNSSATQSTTITFTGQSIGPAAGNRWVLVGIANDGGDVQSVSVGGVSATQIANRGVSKVLSLWAALVPTGTTANIVVNYSDITDGTRIVWWTVNMAAHGAHDTATAAPVGANTFIDVTGIDIPGEGFSIALGMANTPDRTATIDQSYTHRVNNNAGTVDVSLFAADREVSDSVSNITARWSLSGSLLFRVGLFASFRGDGT